MVVVLLPPLGLSALCLRIRGVLLVLLLRLLPDSLEFWSCSNTITTSLILGRNLGSVEMHLKAREAALKAPSIEYWPSRRESNTRNIFLLLAK